MLQLTPSAGTETTRIPGVYTWQPPGKSVAVRLSLDVVDRMLQEVMRGFGAVPKRGAEVGGILLGRTNAIDDKTVVTIDDFEAVPIEYKRGPSYLLSDDDTRTFAAAVERTRNSANPLLRPIGYFRSHTREGVGLGPEDLATIGTYFPQPDAIALIIKPHATKVSEAGFYFREDGKFQPGAPLLEFPFRRRDLDPENAGKSRSARPSERPPSQLPARREHRPVGFEPAPTSRAVAERLPVLETPEPPSIAEPPESTQIFTVETPPTQPPPRDTRRGGRGWVWALLSLVFLLVGVLVGFKAAAWMQPQFQTSSKDPYGLGITITKTGTNVQIRWDRQAPAIRAAQKGVLTIEDGAYSRPVALNAFDLQSGSVVYPPQANRVRFRLDVIVNDHDTVTEVVEWRQ